MRKTRFITLILIIAIVLVGAAYASWYQTTTINTTVSTGNMKVVFEDWVDWPDPMVIADGGYYTFPNSRVLLNSRQDDGHTLTAAFKDVFPGMNYTVPFKIVNKGSIPAVFKESTISYDIDASTIKNGESIDSLKNSLETNLKINNLNFQIFDKNNNKIKDVGPFFNGNQSVSLKDLKAQLDTLLKNSITLEPGQYVSFGKLGFQFGMGFGNEFQNKTFTVNIGFTWKQYNDPS